MPDIPRSLALPRDFIRHCERCLCKLIVLPRNLAFPRLVGSGEVCCMVITVYQVYNTSVV